MTAALTPTSDISDVMKKNYKQYAAYVIMNRAIPDVRDGLKPAQRRLLYTAYELGARANRRHMKSAEISGTAMGRYHPHGDSYGTMVRMGQNWIMRHTLIDGQGNFGSPDDDGCASSRYTEARLTLFAENTFFNDLNEDTVQWQLNYAENRKEPVVLPAELPHLLLNGTHGVAVGLATSILSFNARELIDCLIVELRDGWLHEHEEVHPAFKGPDFPTRGVVEHDSEALRNVWQTGRASFRVRGEARVETNEETGRKSVVITSLPWQVKRNELMQKIAKLVTVKNDDGKRTIEGVSDVRDESTEEGTRVVLDLATRTDPNVVLNLLYKKTRLQDSLSCHLIVIDGDKPRALGVREVLLQWLNFRRECVRRILDREQRELQERLDLIEAYLKVHSALNEVIKLIRESTDAKTALQQHLLLNDRQAEAVVRIPLGRLRRLDETELAKEQQELRKRDEVITKTLNDPSLLDKLIEERLLWWRDQVDERRTQVAGELRDIQLLDTIVKEDVVFSVNGRDEVKITPLSDYRRTRRGASGVKEADGESENAPRFLVKATTHDRLFVFTNAGRCHDVPAYELPLTRRASNKNTPFSKLFSEAEENERIVQVLSLNLDELPDDAAVALLRSDGVMKRLRFSALVKKRGNTCTCMTLSKNTELRSAALMFENDDVLVCTKNGKCRRFPASGNLRLTSNRGSKGVNTHAPDEGDELLSVTRLTKDDDVVTVSEKGFGTRIIASNIPCKKGRSTNGVCLVIANTEDVGNLVFASTVGSNDNLFLTTSGLKSVVFSVTDVRQVGRCSRGVRLQRLNDDETIVAAAKISRID